MVNKTFALYPLKLLSHKKNCCNHRNDMKSLDITIDVLSPQQKDELLLELLQTQQNLEEKRKAGIKRASEIRNADETKRNRHNAHKAAYITKKYREDKEYREKVKEANRRRYWDRKRKDINESDISFETSDPH